MLQPYPTCGVLPRSTSYLPFQQPMSLSNVESSHPADYGGGSVATGADSLIRLHEDRPAFVTYKRGLVCVSIHDAEYLRQRAEWKRKLRAGHSDAGGTTRQTQKLTKDYAAWKATEHAFYAELIDPATGKPLEPPSPPRVHVLTAVDFYRQARGSVGRTRARIAAYRAEHPDASAPMVAKALGISVGCLHTAACRDRRRPLRRSAPLRLLEFLADGRPHSLRQCTDAVGATDGTTMTAVMRLRRRGFVIRTENNGNGMMYRLLAPPQEEKTA